MRLFSLLVLSLFVTTFAYANTRCVDVVSVVECNSDISLELSDNCRNIEEFGDGVYSIQTNPGLSSNPFSTITLRIGQRSVRNCERAPFGGLICTVDPDLTGVFNIRVVESGAVERNKCEIPFQIQLPLTPRTLREE